MKTSLFVTTAALAFATSVAMAAPGAKPLLGSAAAPAASQANEGDIRSRHLAAIDRALAGDTKGAVAALNKLATESKISPEEKDRVYLSIGRINYQDNLDEAAIEAYNKVRRGSPSWLESIEERAWAEIRLGQYDKAMGTLKTVLSPLFKDQIQSEPFFAMAYAELRVCDYKSLFKTIDSFKKKFRPKVQAWEAATDSASKARLQEVSETIQKLNLVEAEGIQRLYLDESGKKLAGSVPRIDKSMDEISFPEVDGGEEVWVDEIDHHAVRVKGCPAPASLAETQSKKEKSL